MGKPLFALIYWYSEAEGQPGTISVERKSALPKNAAVNDVAKLRWTYENGTSKLLNVKILGIDKDQEALKAITVDGEGNVVPIDQRAFTSAVLAAMRTSEVLKRQHKKADESTNRDLAEGHFNDSSIFGARNKAGPNNGVPGTPASRLQEDLPATAPVPPLVSSAIQEGHEEGTEALEVFNFDARESMSKLLQSHSSPEVFKFLKGFVKEIENQNPEEVIPEVVDALQRLSKLSHPDAVIISDDYEKQGAGKVEVYSGCGFWVPEPMHKVIVARSKSDSGWKKYVLMTLTQVYSDNFRWVSALGHGKATGVHKSLYNGLYSYATSKEPTLSSKDFNKYIDTSTANARMKYIYTPLEVPTRKRKFNDKASSSSSPIVPSASLSFSIETLTQQGPGKEQVHSVEQPFEPSANLFRGWSDAHQNYGQYSQDSIQPSAVLHPGHSGSGINPYLHGPTPPSATFAGSSSSLPLPQHHHQPNPPYVQ